VEGDYGYANARIRALKSYLLDEHTYDALLAAISIDACIEVLAGTTYKAEIEAALIKYGGMKCIAEALRGNITNTVGRLRTFFRGRPRELVAILLARWDIFNLLTILRGQVRGVSADEILETLVPAGELTEVELREIAQQPNIRATADLMLTWHLPYARPLARALEARRDTDLLYLETRLNQLRYREALESLGDEENDGLVKEMLQAEIDVVNVTTLLRLGRLRDRATQLRTRYGRSDALPLLIPGGGLDDRTLAALSQAADVESIVRALSGSPYARVLADRMPMYQQSDDLAALGDGLDAWLVHKGVRTFYRDPLSIAVAIGYIWAKTNEVRNLRLIATGKALGFDHDVIQGELIRV
jgi:V/A-type H+-transporting ATPase subunit C